MSPIYIADGKILVSSDGKLASLPCPTGCCGREPPGVCCSGVWYDDPTAGVCCSGTNAPSGIWVPSNLPVENGVCCGGDWYPPSVPGKCCGSVWYPGDPPQCPEGRIYLTWGNGNCCGCVPIQVLDPQTNEMVNANDRKDEFCCPVCTGGTYLPTPEGCLGRCCIGCSCTPDYNFPCILAGGQWYEGCCEAGCPQPCCGEDDDCNVTCETIGSELCDAPRVLGECGVSCPDACLGACCENGAVIGQTTQNACTGCWSGPGSTTCTGACVNDGECCESKTSKDAGLTFSRPPSLWNRCKNCSTLQPETLRVAVTGTTDSPILIHGTPFGADGARCSINHSFLICWENFNIEPVPCGTNFRYLDVTVCWETEATDTEALDFSGCNGLDVWLGACDYDCVTTLSYNRGGHTSDVHIQLYGDGIIEANGTGPLVLNRPTAVTVPNSCVETLTLTGTNTQNNEISGAIQDSFSGGLGVIKTGPGLWRLSGENTYTDGLSILNGTIVIASAVDLFTPSGPLGQYGGPSSTLIIGTSESGATGAATLLVEGGINSPGEPSIRWPINIAALGSGASQAIVIGAIGTGEAVFGISNSSTITVLGPGRSITLQASDSAVLVFSSIWSSDPVVTYNIGSEGNAGVVEIRSDLSGGATSVNIVNGTAQLSFPNRIDSDTPVTISAAMLDIIDSAYQQLSYLSFTNNSGRIVSSSNNGTLNLITGAIVDVSGNSHEITLPVVLESDITINGSGDLLIAGVISGSYNITKNDSGIVTLSGNNTYTGTTTINSGTVKANNLAAFGTGAIVVNAGGTLNKNGYALANSITNNGGTIIP